MQRLKSSSGSIHIEVILCRKDVLSELGVIRKPVIKLRNSLIISTPKVRKCLKIQIKTEKKDRLIIDRLSETHRNDN